MKRIVYIYVAEKHCSAYFLKLYYIKMRWTFIKTPPQDKVKLIQESLSINEKLAKILVQREVDSFEKARLFFRPSLTDLHNPYLMKDMDKAIERIEKAI